MENLTDKIHKFLYGSPSEGTYYGNKYGASFGDAFGSGRKNGSGYGGGDGSGNGDDIGDGIGSGNSIAFRHDYGHGESYGYGSTFGTGCGAYMNVRNTKLLVKPYALNLLYRGNMIYKFYGFQAVITHVHGNVAEGDVINKDLTAAPCFIVKHGGDFWHGSTLREAVDAMAYPPKGSDTTIYGMYLS